MALSSFVQTRSMELVLAPIASHVSQLMNLLEARGRTSCPDLMHAAVSIMDAVQNMSTAAQQVIYGSEDEQLQSDMPVVIEIALKSAEQVLEAAGRLVEEPHSKDVQSLLVRGTHGVLEGTMKVLLVWDSAEVNKIVQTAHWVLDRLELVQGSKSMRSLVICFGGFSEAMMPLLRMTDKRQMELTNPEQKKRLLAALSHVKKYLPSFTASMQAYIKSPSAESKESKNSLACEISSGIRNLIKSVKLFDNDEEEEGAVNMATNIIHVQRKLATTERFFIGSELDKHLNEIYQNSHAVAHVSREIYKAKILSLCDEIKLLRQTLEEQQDMVHTNPESSRAKEAFDQTAETMCDKLLELDRWVADSVVDLVTDTFVETSEPINHLVHVATTAASASLTTASPRMKQTATTVTAPPLSQSLVSSASPPPTSSQLEESMKGLDDEVKLFRRHSRRMSQVAAYAAQSSADSQRVTLIKDLADEVDNLTSEVVNAVLDVRKTPGSKEAREKLDSLRQSWASKVHELTGAIDDVIDPEDFVTISEANIQQDMARCRDAIQDGKWEELIRIVKGIAAKAGRIVEVGRATVEGASDKSYKIALAKAVENLERAIPKMLSLANKVASNPSNQEVVNEFITSLRELLASIHDIQQELSRGIDVPEQEEEEVDVGMEEDSDPCNTSSTVTAQERMMRKNLERLRSQPRYIGSLRKRMRSTPRTIESESQQSSPHKHGREDSVLSFSDGFSQSFGSGDAETQTPRHKMKDQFSQVEQQYLSTNATLGSPVCQSETLSPLSLSLTSWTTPTPSSPLHSMGTSTTCTQASPPRVLPPTPTEKAMKSYVSPLQRLVTAAKEGDSSQLPGHASALSARAIRLTEFAKSAADTVKDNAKLVKVLKVKSSEVNLLTPQMIEQAEEVAKNPHQRNKLDDLEATSHQWAGHVKQLIDATQQANLPWSKTAENLQKAAKSEDEDLQIQIDHVSTQTNRMVDIATMTVKAAETEEAIGLMDNSDSGDAELQEQVQRVRVTASDIEKLTPQLLGAAKRAVGMGENSAAMERLNLLSEDWATKAKVLMKSVDDVSLGMGGSADTLFISARSGDKGLLAEQTTSIKTLAESLHDIAQDSVERCTDTGKVKVVRVAAKDIVKLSTRLIDCAKAVANDCQGDNAEPTQRNVEDMELLRRDWAAQVHLLTAHIDDITAEVSSPLDHLVDVALQANQRSGMAKQHLMDQFESKASFLSDQLDAVSELFHETTDPVTDREAAIDRANAALDFLKKLTPHAIGAARSLASDPGSAMLEHFNHLRRQWASKAQVLVANLQNITSADMGRVLDAFDDLLHLSKRISVATSPLQKSYSNEDVSLLGERLASSDLSFQEPSTPKAAKTSPGADNEVVLRKHTPRSDRHISMAIPLPSWNGIDSALDASSRSIAFAAQSLKDITDGFEEKNPIVDVAKKMAEQMSQMADYARGRGDLQNKEDMIHTAKAIAANGQAIVRFANIISELCTDKKTKASLQSCAEMIPTLSTQLRIIASVKASTPDDTSADVMLVKNAQNLMRAVIKTVYAAEAACMKGLNAPEGDDEAARLASHWRRKLYHQRTIEAIRAPRGEKGLRKLNKDRISTPSVVDGIKPAPSAMISPTKLTPSVKYM